MDNLMTQNKPSNLYTLKNLLERANAGGYAIGAFSARSTAMIRTILQAGEETRSPLLVQVAQIELERYGMSASEVAKVFYDQLAELAITIPVGLHLDHTKHFDIIEEAIASGFTSVMIDASERDFNDNILITRRVVEYAHACGVSVEGELGRIGTADFVETLDDEESYTDPVEAEVFARETGVDALAVSVGTVHGVYKVKQQKIDLERIREIRAHTPVLLVLHGGSGNPVDRIRAAIQQPGGGVSKINIATDLELAFLNELGREKYLTNAQVKALPSAERERGLAAVKELVKDKICNYLLSADRAADFSA
jgi:ketose-bisphosphate aldolase